MDIELASFLDNLGISILENELSTVIQNITQSEYVMHIIDKNIYLYKKKDGPKIKCYKYFKYKTVNGKITNIHDILDENTPNIFRYNTIVIDVYILNSTPCPNGTCCDKGQPDNAACGASASPPNVCKCGISASDNKTQLTCCTNKGWSMCAKSCKQPAPTPTPEIKDCSNYPGAIASCLSNNIHNLHYKDCINYPSENICYTSYLNKRYPNKTLWKCCNGITDPACPTNNNTAFCKLPTPAPTPPKPTPIPLSPYTKSSKISDCSSLFPWIENIDLSRGKMSVSKYDCQCCTGKIQDSCKDPGGAGGTFNYNYSLQQKYPGTILAAAPFGWFNSKSKQAGSYTGMCNSGLIKDIYNKQILLNNDPLCFRLTNPTKSDASVIAVVAETCGGNCCGVYGNRNPSPTDPNLARGDCPRYGVPGDPYQNDHSGCFKEPVKSNLFGYNTNNRSIPGQICQDGIGGLSINYSPLAYNGYLDQSMYYDTSIITVGTSYEYYCKQPYTASAGSLDWCSGVWAHLDLNKRDLSNLKIIGLDTSGITTVSFERVYCPNPVIP